LISLSPEQDRLAQIFFGYARTQQANADAKGTRFVHYTSAEAAVNILRTREVWMRESSCMNDFMEVEHGIRCVVNAYHANEKAFGRRLDGLFPGISGEIEKLFDGWAPHLRTDTYLTCLSEHDDSEDTFGRLSMWRAYSEATGVALVLHNKPFFTENTALKAYASPVAYLNDASFAEEFENVGRRIDGEADFLRGLDRQILVNNVFQMLKYAALCTKHPGFREEREWRVIYCPALEKSAHLVKGIQTVRGVPQAVYKIPLKDTPDEGLVGIEIPALVERVIIGPTAYPLAVRKAFVALLADAGMSDADKKVFMSDIPLRK
jgi:hypothetical protein